MSEEYVSPLLSRIREEESLTLENLARYVPIVHKGKAATEALETQPDLTPAQKRQYRRQVNQAEQAKEKLVLMALPLIKNLAHKEYRRRQSWGSRITYEDIVSEGLGGFIRGIYAYNPEGKHKSPTNYLGQWIVTDMKRNVEALEHDFSVPYEAIERQRKIRAIRSRLGTELGREATDEEVIAAANQSGSIYNENMMGRVDKSKGIKDGSRKRIITQKHIDEERDMSKRTGALTPADLPAKGDQDNTINTIDTHDARSITVDDEGWQPKGEAPARSLEELEEQETRKRLGELLEHTFQEVGVRSTQREIIRRRFGLPPYEEEQKIKDIAEATQVAKYRVSRIISIFGKVMNTPGGAFHKILSSLDDDEIDALQLHWIKNTLDKSPATSSQTPKDLTTSLSNQAPTAQQRHSTSKGNLTTYLCSAEQQHFTMNFEATAPMETKCPHCGQLAQKLD